jgi:phosphoribosylformylglycinamidine synthase
LLADWSKSATIGFVDQTSLAYPGTPHETEEGARIMLVGTPRGHLGQSLWLREIHGREDGSPPPVDLAAERKVGEFIRGCIEDGIVLAVHDVSDGGVLVAIAEMALAGNLGAFIFSGPWEEHGSAAAFAEDQGLYVVSTIEPSNDFIARGREAGIDVRMMGRVGGSDEAGNQRIVIDFVAPDFDDSKGDVVISLAELRTAHEGFFPTLMGEDAALA